MERGEHTVTDTPELLAAYKRLALAYLARKDIRSTNEFAATRVSDHELDAAESALRALLAPKREDLIEDLREVRSFVLRLMPEDSCEIKTIDRAIAALEGSK
jgi:hypothetical protein